MTTQASTNKHAERFRELAETVDAKRTELERPRLDNTPKRARQAMEARIEARNLARVADALRIIADGHERGDLPPMVEAIRTRAALEPMVTKRTGSTGYYEVHESDEWRSDTPEAQAVRAYIDAHKSDAQQQQEAKTAAALKVAQLERSVKFSSIDGFFPTPPALIARMMAASDADKGMKALEPSAGKGDILQAMHDAGLNAVGFEINHTLAGICQAKGLRCQCYDFVSIDPIPMLDRVLMNPPFEHHQDAKHIRRAFDWLKPGGRIVAIACANVTFADRCQWFRDWLEEVGATVEELPPGSFADGFVQTNVNTVLIVIDK